MRIDRFTKTGKYHLETAGSNQDYMLSAEGDDYLAVMLADGATSCRKGLDGARLACGAAEEIITYERKVFFRYPPAKIGYLLTEHILYRVGQNIECGYEQHDYGSTFMLAYMEKKSGKSVLVNLGDGAAFRHNAGGTVCLMKPKRYRGDPCLTTTAGRARAVDAGVFDIACGESVFLCTDGFINALDNAEVAASFSGADHDRLRSALALVENADDCSYISFLRK